MAKPRIFISSTCFDLNDIRSELTSFLESYNFEVLNSQLPNFGVSPQRHSHTACLDQVYNADYLILIIGKRHGGTYIGSTSSITNEEYKLATKRGIPILVFVNRQVDDTLHLYKKNSTMNFSSIVDDNRIFDFIEYIKSSSKDNWVHQYDNINDIKETIKAQLSYYLLLFSQSLVKSTKKEKDIDSSKIAYVKFPSNIDEITKKGLDQLGETALRNGLRELHRVVTSILSSPGKNDNKIEKLKVIWVMAKYGETNYDGTCLRLNNNLFKDYAWSSSRGKRVADQMKPFCVWYEYDYDEDDGSCDVKLFFKNENEDCSVVYALKNLIGDLCAKYNDDEALDLFMKADLRIYMQT